MVEVTRSNVVESVHYGTAILINSDGEYIKGMGQCKYDDLSKVSIKTHSITKSL